MKNFAVLAMGAVVFLSASACSEAQILQRFRNNVRGAISGPTVPQAQNFNAPSYVQPQIRNQRPAPTFNSTVPQRLTPYSRLTPQQRVSVPQQQRSISPRLTAPAPVANPAVQSTGDAQIRIVTYYDPRSGRTFQRRYLIPGTPSTRVTRAPQGQIATGGRSIFTRPNPTNGTVASNPSANSIRPSTPSLVPPIQFSPQITQQPVDVSTVSVPALAGPVLAAPTSVAQPIAASVDLSETPSQVETASAELEGAETEIPDLSGITVDPAPLEPAPSKAASIDLKEEASQELFFAVDSTDEIIEESDDNSPAGVDFSVLEEAEDE